MTTDDLLKQGIAALKDGRKAQARSLLTQVVEQDERNEMAWLWLSGAVDTDEDRRICLENVLAINPNSGVARRGLESLIAKEGVRPLIAASALASGTKLTEDKPATRPVVEAREDIKPEASSEGYQPTPRTKARRKKTGSGWKWLLLGGVGTAFLFLVACFFAYTSGVIDLPSGLELGEIPISIPERNPVPELVRTWLPPGYEYVSDYVTTAGGDTIWVVEVTEPKNQMILNQFAVFFHQFAKTVDTSDVAWLKLSIVKSEAWMPYAKCVRSGPARAAARGDITSTDLFMQFEYCP